MIIRKTTLEDLDAIKAIYAYARDYMRESGNPTQWGHDYPSHELLLNDIKKEHSYVAVSSDHQVHGVFVFTIGEDPTYTHIENGQWLNDKPYGTIHRIASDGSQKGIGRFCFDYCKEEIKDLRCDTHANNHTMQAVLLKTGFQACGTIYVADGSPRIAYHFVGEK